MPELPDPTTINVANLTQLNAAILQVDQATTPSAYTIQFTATISDGGTDVTALNLASGVSVTIDGGSYALDGSENTGSGLFVYAGNVTLQNLTIQNAGARGGSGGFGGGGGGAGLGGGLFVASAGTVTLNNVTFNDDAAQGGNGGQGSFNYSAESSAVTTATTNVEHLLALGADCVIYTPRTASPSSARKPGLQLPSPAKSRAEGRQSVPRRIQRSRPASESGSDCHR